MRKEHDFARWEAAYLRSLEYYKALLPERLVSTIYFGGGTPSLMPADMVGRILDKIRALWPCVNDLEITLEANPTSIEMEKFQAFKDVGVNRVSIGVQAMNDQDLQFLGRAHDRAQAEQALEIAADVFDRFSFDLIYARPEQSLQAWEAELKEALGFAKGHMSMYQLTIERNTPFYFDHAKGHFVIPKEELAADFYLLTQEVMQAGGLPLYEVSNHASDEEQYSQHNLRYWNYGEYIGIGPGAHGRIEIDGHRHASRDHYAPESWLSWVEEKGCGAHPFEALSAEDQCLEALMMGLRLREGMPFERIENLAGRQREEVLDFSRLDALADDGALDYDDKHMHLSIEGLLKLNAIVPFILR